MLENKAWAPYFRQCKLSTVLTQLDHMIIPQSAIKNHSRVPISGEQKDRTCLQVTKPPQSYSFRLIYSRVRTKITQSYFFRSIYPRVRTKITPKQVHIHNTQSTQGTIERPLSFYRKKTCINPYAQITPMSPQESVS